MSEKILRPRGLAKSEASVILGLLQAKGTVTIEDLTQTNIRERYIFKYIFSLRSDGHNIKANRIGRKVVSYTLVNNQVAQPVEEAVAA